MVDPVAPKSAGNVSRLRAVSAVAAVPTAIIASQTASTPALSGLARAMAAAPPVDQDRVARIRKAVADGTFPISPAKIADRLIALRLEWNPDDAA